VADGARARALAALAEVRPPAGRSSLSNTQWLAEAQVYATLALAEQVEVANMLQVLHLGAPAVEEDSKPTVTPVAAERQALRNALRARIREGLGL
jgi:hypothetical protein